METWFRTATKRHVRRLTGRSDELGLPGSSSEKEGLWVRNELRDGERGNFEGEWPRSLLRFDIYHDHPRLLHLSLHLQRPCLHPLRYVLYISWPPLIRSLKAISTVQDASQIMSTHPTTTATPRSAPHVALYSPPVSSSLTATLIWRSQNLPVTPDVSLQPLHRPCSPELLHS